MQETAAAVGNDELVALKRVALAGGLARPVKLSCAELADRLDASNQTASRRLRRLEDAGYLDRDIVTDGQWVELTANGEDALRSEYADYRRLFESDARVVLEGQVTGGMGEGRHYISLPGYMRQFRDRLGYEPFPGTLNVELEAGSVRARAGLDALDAIPIDGWSDDDRTFGPATCYAARIDSGGNAEDGHLIVPERTHHDEANIEMIAPVKLRDRLGLEDGDRVAIRVRDAEGAER